LELGEVDLLTLFLHQLGPAEVATWALMGSIWDILEASTEGISEAAAIRVAFHLSASQPALAKKLSHKAMFWTVVQALILTSILLMVGRNLIVVLTVDYTLQHLLDSLLGLVGLANLSMAFAQVCWSLIGAQGRFNLATLVMLVCRWLVTMPLALIFIFGMNFDLYTVAGALAVGSAISACVLAVVLFSSNWHEVAQQLFIQGLLSCDDDDDDFDFSFGDEEASDDENDDGDDGDEEESVGPNGSGYPSNNKSWDNDKTHVLPESTEPTSRTGTNTGSGVNSGADSSGLISGGTAISGISEQ
jgi:MatE